MQQLRSLWLIALTEWKLQIRSAIFWASLVVLLVYTLAQTIGAPGEMVFLPSAWLGTRDDSLLWLSIGLIFLVPSALLRDRRTGAFVWTTPTTGYTYVAGKLLGCWLTALTLAGIELTAQFVARIQGWEYLTLETVSMILSSLGRWIVGIIYMTNVFFMMTIITKGRSLAAYACCSAYFIATFSVKDIANPLCLFPFPVFRSDLVWNGPESILFDANRALYLSLAATLGMLVLLMYPWFERRTVSVKATRNVLVVGVMLSLGITGWAVRSWNNARSKVFIPDTLRLDAPSVLADGDVKSIRVVARFMPMDGLVQGNVQLFLTRVVPNLHFYVPPGLELTSATDCHGQALAADLLGSGWVQVINPSSDVCVTFEGTWLVDRGRYQRSGFRPHGLIGEAYSAHGYLYLAPGARWYPAPVGPYERQVNHDIEIILPQDLSVLASPEVSSKSANGWITYRWQNARGKPLILLVAGKYREVTLSSGDIVLVSPGHERIAVQTADFYLEILTPIETLVGMSHVPHKIVETPLLRWPIASSDLVLLPESYFAERLLKSLSGATFTMYEATASSWGESFALGYEAYYIARGWLQGEAYFADPAFVERETGFGFDTISPDQADPLSDYVPLRECIARYLAAQLVDQRLETNMLEKVIDERVWYADQYLSNPTGQGSGVSLSSLPVNAFETSWTFNQMFAAFGRLERHVGRGQVNFMIGQLLESHAGSTITLQNWLEVVETIAGREARQEFEAGIQGVSE